MKVMPWKYNITDTLEGDPAEKRMYDAQAISKSFEKIKHHLNQFRLKKYKTTQSLFRDSMPYQCGAKFGC